MSTFGLDCEESVLANVCPNYSGSYYSRPIRPEVDWLNGNSLSHYPAGK
ncbi:DUF1272 domain-containing protein [Agarivorans sp. Alg241-V36]|nr:DUF1272 domain-containing protein [Agarivorans sp. Alg241-V36]